VRGVGAQRVTHTPRRARSGDCGRAQILLPTELTVRRADTTEAIGNALVAMANGAGTAPSPQAWIARNLLGLTYPLWSLIGTFTRRHLIAPNRRT
jgi:hypothetical protein